DTFVAEAVAVRFAVKSPVLAGTVPGSFGSCPTLKKETLPEIELAVTKLPLKTRVPASRPTLPIGNSMAPEKVTLSGAACSHCAWVGSAGGFKFETVSSSSNAPLPPDAASNRNECSSIPENLNSTFQRPIRLGGRV